MLLLPYAKKITLIDSYFNTTRYTFRKSLELIAEEFGSRRGMHQDRFNPKAHSLQKHLLLR